MYNCILYAKRQCQSRHRYLSLPYYNNESTLHAVCPLMRLLLVHSKTCRSAVALVAGKQRHRAFSKAPRSPQ